ncbi:MAG TPA: cupin domain-containing protein [Gaiellaceae bacterium]|jgi:quercetin dioxygenase-like cupin family protein|nr:cupin domain-containing protein [Gaiellaceae bacterium]
MPATTGEEIALGGITIRFLLEGEQTNGAVSVFEFDVDAGSPTPPPHSHDGYEETVYGLRGGLTWTVDGERHELAEGDVLCIPRGAVHRFENEGDVTAATLAVVTPGILGPDYFRELSAVLAAAAGGPPDFAELAAIMRRHGLTPA